MPQMNYDDDQSLTPEQKKAVYDSLTEKYAAAGDRSDLARAEKKSNMQRMGAGLMDGFAMYTAADNGVKPVNFDSMRAEADKRVIDAQNMRKERMDGVLKTDQMERMAEDRSFEDKNRGRKEKDWQENDKAAAVDNDVNSKESEIARDLAKKMMPEKDFSGMTAAQLKKGLPMLEKMYAAEQASTIRRDSMAERKDARADSKEERENFREENRVRRDEEKTRRQDEKDFALATPYGAANTEQDAKDIKAGHEAKKSFDSKLDEMIELRTKHNGGALFNREDVDRGQQLSKDLLLEYKNMAKLGVLSQADEKIINAIIPDDPLEYKAAGLLGQDPVMNNMKKFKIDSDNNFAERIKTRIRGGGSQGANKAPTPQVPQGGFNGADLP